MTENQINKIDLMENNLGSDVNVIPENSNKKRDACNIKFGLIQYDLFIFKLILTSY